ncbi:MAG TPA: gamma-glutamylcyclotransferase family protein [Anaeromyxobacteraceae bacterium]|nr:gamma-glutamylcyclotransferase family protein [Anaeromyxobacteraceae bacterium]
MPLPISAPGHQAAPGADFVWFVYGSSLDREAFRAWAAEHGYALPDASRGFAARLDGWRLAFDVASRYWGGAVGSLVPEAGRSVEGLALPMQGAARGLAEHKEGAVSGLYRARPVEVAPLAGGPAVAAVAYLSSPERRLPSEQPPAAAWLEAVIRGARSSGLSPGWIAELERLRG